MYGFLKSQFKENLNVFSIFYGTLIGIIVASVVFSYLASQNPVLKTLAISNIPVALKGEDKELITKATSRFEESASLLAALHYDKITEDDFIRSISLGMTYFDRFDGYYGSNPAMRENMLFSFGAEVSVQGNKVRVDTVGPQSPWDKAGILPGDILVFVDGVDDFNARELMKAYLLSLVDVNEKGFSTLFGFKRGEVEFSITSTPVKYSVPDALDYGMKDGVLHVVLRTFSYTLFEDMKKVIDERVKEGEALGVPVRGLILDLRNNRGGYASVTDDILDAFLGKGRVMYTNSVPISGVKIKKSMSDEIWPFLDIVILQNGHTASASELVSGSLKENGRAFIMGWKTFGKGSTSVSVPSSYGGSLKVSISKFTVGETNVVIANKGVLPNQSETDDDPLLGPNRFEEDTLLLNAYAHLLKDKNTQ